MIARNPFMPDLCVGIYGKTTTKMIKFSPNTVIATLWQVAFNRKRDLICEQIVTVLLVEAVINVPCLWKHVESWTVHGVNFISEDYYRYRLWTPTISGEAKYQHIRGNYMSAQTSSCLIIKGWKQTDCSTISRLVRDVQLIDVIKKFTRMYVPVEKFN